MLLMHGPMKKISIVTITLNAPFSYSYPNVNLSYYYPYLLAI